MFVLSHNFYDAVFKEKQKSTPLKQKRAQQQREQRACKQLTLSQSSNISSSSNNSLSNTSDNISPSCDVNSVNIVSPAPSDSSLSSETSTVSSSDDCQMPDDSSVILPDNCNICN